MTTMKEFYEKIKADLQDAPKQIEPPEAQEPVEPPEILDAFVPPEIPAPGIEPPEQIQGIVLFGTCLSCGSIETLACREVSGKVGIISYHCSKCGRNWKLEVNAEIERVTWYATETNWLDLYNEQNDD